MYYRVWILKVLWIYIIYLYPGGAQSRALIENGSCSTEKATSHENWSEGSVSQFQLHQQCDFNNLSCLGWLNPNLTFMSHLDSG